MGHIVRPSRASSQPPQSKFFARGEKVCLPLRDETILSVGRIKDVPTCWRIALGFTLFERVFVIDSSFT